MIRRLLPASWAGRLFLLFCALFTVANLSYGPLTNPDEGRYSSTAYEMAFGFNGENPDWLVPHFNTLARLNKPPLIYWGVASAFKVFGVSEWSARLPSALAALFILLLLYCWGARAFNPRVGLGAALVWATSLFPVIMGRTSNTDMLLAASMLLAAFGIFWAIESPRKLLFGVIAGIGFGLALLSKGPVGMALPLIAAFLYLTLTKSWKRTPWGALVVALVVGVMIGLPWYLAVEAQRPGFIHHFIFDENLNRFSNHQDFHEKKPITFYLPLLFAGLLFWTPLALPVFTKWRENDELATRTKTFALIWAVFIFAFFSISGTKLYSYVLPAFPALALLLGAAIARWEWQPRRNRGWAIGLLLTLNLLLICAALIQPKRDKQTKQWHIMPSALLDDRLIPQKTALPYVMLMVGILSADTAMILAVSRRPSGKNLLLVHGLSSAALMVIFMRVLGTGASYDDATYPFQAVAPYMKPDDEIAGRAVFAPTAMFYTRRPVTFFNFGNTSGLSDEEIARSRYFITANDDATVQKWLNDRPNRAFMLVKYPEDAPASLYFWGRNNDYFLYANRPRPADFNLARVAPKEPKGLPLDLEPEQQKRRAANANR